MEIKKSLFMLEYGDRRTSHLVPIYAENQEAAWEEAKKWAGKHNITLPGTVTLIRFPAGFLIFRRRLPGEVIQTDEEENE